MKGLPYEYKCPLCGNFVATISNTYPPVCRNKDVHSATPAVMELQNEKSTNNNGRRD